MPWASGLVEAAAAAALMKEVGRVLTRAVEVAAPQAGGTLTVMMTVQRSVRPGRRGPRSSLTTASGVSLTRCEEEEALSCQGDLVEAKATLKDSKAWRLRQ